MRTYLLVFNIISILSSFGQSFLKNGSVLPSELQSIKFEVKPEYRIKEEKHIYDNYFESLYDIYNENDSLLYRLFYSLFNNKPNYDGMKAYKYYNKHRLTAVQSVSVRHQSYGISFKKGTNNYHLTGSLEISNDTIQLKNLNVNKFDTIRTKNSQTIDWKSYAVINQTDTVLFFNHIQENLSGKTFSTETWINPQGDTTSTYEYRTTTLDTLFNTKDSIQIKHCYITSRNPEFCETKTHYYSNNHLIEETVNSQNTKMIKHVKYIYSDHGILLEENRIKHPTQSHHVINKFINNLKVSQRVNNPNDFIKSLVY